MNDRPDLEALQKAYREQSAPVSLTRRIVAATESQRSYHAPWLPAFGGAAAALVLGLFVFFQQTAVTPKSPQLTLSQISAEVSRAERALSRELSAGKTKAPSLGSLPSVSLTPVSPKRRAPAKETHSHTPENTHIPV